MIRQSFLSLPSSLVSGTRYRPKTDRPVLQALPELVSLFVVMDNGEDGSPDWDLTRTRPLSRPDDIHDLPVAENGDLAAALRDDNTDGAGDFGDAGDREVP